MNVDNWYSCCSNCQWNLKFYISQPYRDYTYRIEIKCNNYECDEQGIQSVIEVKQ